MKDERVKRLVKAPAVAIVQKVKDADEPIHLEDVIFDTTDQLFAYIVKHQLIDSYDEYDFSDTADDCLSIINLAIEEGSMDTVTIMEQKNPYAALANVAFFALYELLSAKVEEIAEINNVKLPW